MDPFTAGPPHQSAPSKAVHQRRGRRTLSNDFWLLFLASTVVHIGFSASTPLLPRFVEDVFEADPVTIGAVVAAMPVVSLLTQPVAGVAADRFGYRRLCVAGSLTASIGMFLAAVATSVPVVGLSRVVFGAGDAAALTGLMAWIIAGAKPTARGRALSLFGVSVWIGVSIGPLIGETIYQSSGFRAVWTVCSILLLIAVAATLLASSPETDGEHSLDSHSPAGSREWRAIGRAIARPSTVAALVWGAQGVLFAYLVLHLESRGMRTDGPTGAAAVFTVFALSVIVARVLLGSVPDRLGAMTSARYALIFHAVALIVLTVASSFPVAALGAVLLGIAFAPLYPALVMLAVQDLDSSKRGTGLGGFNALSSLGLAVGSFAGGVLSGWWGEWSALTAAAACQVLALLILRPERK